jgi:hypothetical protein
MIDHNMRMKKEYYDNVIIILYVYINIRVDCLCFARRDTFSVVSYIIIIINIDHLKVCMLSS